MHLIKKVWRWSEQPTQTKRRWTLAVSVTLAVLFTVVYGNDRADRQRAVELSERDLAAAVYAAEIARYEAARIEHFVCTRNVARRADLRRVLLSFAALHETRGFEGFVAETEQLLDASIPTLDDRLCPTVPARPQPPDEEDRNGP